jgi:regulatory protein
MLNKFFTKEQAIQKIKHYCSYQERSHYEVKEKLFSYGLFKKTVEEILALLIEEDYLNEERFAKCYVSGKFKMNHWGRIKITQGLKQRQVSPYNIRSAMKHIDEESYRQTLNKLAQQKWDRLKGEQYLRRQAKTTDYLLQKGFESSLVYAAVKTFQEGNKK